MSRRCRGQWGPKDAVSCAHVTIEGDNACESGNLVLTRAPWQALNLSGCESRSMEVRAQSLPNTPVPHDLRTRDPRTRMKLLYDERSVSIYYGNVRIIECQPVGPVERAY